MSCRPRPPELCDSIASEDSVSRSWAYNSTGSIEHKASGMRVSPCRGIQCDGREYKLAADDIELDDDSPLGSGASGTVWRGRIKSTGTPVAVKSLNVGNAEERKLLLNEVRVLIESEGCQNLIQWHAGFASHNRGQVHLVLELMDCGNLSALRTKVGRLPVPILAAVALQVLTGLAELHRRRYVHNDIKPQNILLSSNGEVKITDFGITRLLDVSLCGTCLGTQAYLAPEKITASGPGQGYSFPADLWSFGVVMYELASGVHPFASADNFAHLFNVVLLHPEPRLHESDGHSSELCDFVAQCLTRDQSQRADAEQLLAHTFLSNAASPFELSAWLASLQE